MRLSAEEIWKKYEGQEVWSLCVNGNNGKPNTRPVQFLSDGNVADVNSFRFIHGRLVGREKEPRTNNGMELILLHPTGAPLKNYIFGAFAGKFTLTEQFPLLWDMTAVVTLDTFITPDNPWDDVIEPKKPEPYPHKCPACKNKAIILFSSIECTGIGCRHFKLGKGI